MSVADKQSDPKATGALDPNAYLARYHRPDLAYSGDPRSALRRNAAVCREIVLLDQLKETMIKSRLAAGILLVPEEVTFPPDDDGIEDVDDGDRFLEVLLKHISAPVEDRRNAAALAPLVVRVPGELIKDWKLLSLSDGILDLDSVESARERALRRLAGGIDLPLERMQGLGSTSHWNAAAIDIDEIRKHIIPLGERLARFFTVAYFQRMLIVAEDMDEATASRWALEYDASEILTRMDTAASADALHADGLISDEARIQAHGFDPAEVRPSDQERWRRIIEKLAVVPHQTNRPLLAGLGIDFAELGIPPDVIEAFLAAVPAEPAPTTDANDPDPDTGVGDPQVNTDPVPAGRPTPATEPDGLDEQAMVVLERLRTASSAAVDRALERAANQVMTQSRKLAPEVRARVDTPAYRTGPRKVDVLRVLSPTDWRAIQRSPEALLRGCWDDLTGQAVAWLRDHYERQDIDPMIADETARRAASDLATQLDALALGAFRHPIRREVGLSVPMDLIVDTVPITVP